MLIKYSLLKPKTLIKFSIFAVFLSSCGSLYTPQDLPRDDAEVTSENQKIDVEFVELNLNNLRQANRDAYARRVIDGDNLNAPAKLNTVSSAFHSHWPSSGLPPAYIIGVGDVLNLKQVVRTAGLTTASNDKLKVSSSGYVNLLSAGDLDYEENLPPLVAEPVYKIGPGDVLQYTMITLDPATSAQQVIELRLSVTEAGTISILGVGQVSVGGLELGAAQQEVEQALLRQGLPSDFNLSILEYNSQKFVVGGDFVSNGVFPFRGDAANLNDLIVGGSLVPGISELNVLASDAEAEDFAVVLLRDNQEYKISAKRLLTDTRTFFILPGDRIFVQSRALKEGPARIKVAGLTVEQANSAVLDALKRGHRNLRADLAVEEFLSQKFAVSGEVLRPGVYPITDSPVLISEALTRAGIVSKVSNASVSNISIDKKVTLRRGKSSFHFSAEDLLEKPAKYYIYPGDRLVVKSLRFRSEKVILAGAVAKQTVFPISAETRQTLSDALYSTSALAGVDSDPSQVYVIRKTDNIRAYHLDVSNPANLVLANSFELRPDDVVFVSEQPIRQFNRVIREILVSVGSIKTLATGG